MHAVNIAQQVKAARGWLGWSRKELSRKAGVHYNTLKYLENNEHQRKPLERTIEAIRIAFDTAGVMFHEHGVSQKHFIVNEK